MPTQTLEITGADLSGTNGTANRTYTFPYADVSATGMQIFVNGIYQHQGVGYDYTVSGTIITFLNAIFNAQIISGRYTTGSTSTEDVDYCLIQDVYDELDGKTSTDISEERVINAIQRAEGLIDTRTGTSFKVITATDEVHTGDRYSLDISPDYLDTVASTTTLRRDSWGNIVHNRIKTNYKPIISVTSLSYNSAGPDSADSWTALTEQTGSAGDFVIEDKNAGIIDMITTYPRIGKRSWKITYTYGYDPTSSDRRVLMIVRCVRRLTILLACKQIVTTKSSGSMFDSPGDIKFSEIEIRSSAGNLKTYISSIDMEIADLWTQLGGFGVEVI